MRQQQYYRENTQHNQTLRKSHQLKREFCNNKERFYKQVELQVDPPWSRWGLKVQSGFIGLYVSASTNQTNQKKIWVELIRPAKVLITWSWSCPSVPSIIPQDGPTITSQFPSSSLQLQRKRGRVRFYLCIIFGNEIMRYKYCMYHNICTHFSTNSTQGGPFYLWGTGKAKQSHQ